jgi:hypothetical protein
MCERGGPERETSSPDAVVQHGVPLLLVLLPVCSRIGLLLSAFATRIICSFDNAVKKTRHVLCFMDRPGSSQDWTCVLWFSGRRCNSRSREYIGRFA